MATLPERDRLCGLPRARRRRARRSMAARRQGREQAQHLARLDRVRRAADRERLARKDMLFIIGGSAGGNHDGAGDGGTAGPVRGRVRPCSGRERHPFRVQPAGPANIPEFGTIKDKQGFENLLAMDTVQHVKPGVKYPPIMITTGLNDPRVSSWEPAKFAATLRTAAATKPVLFRVDEKAGHGIGSTKTPERRAIRRRRDVHSGAFGQRRPRRSPPSAAGGRLGTPVAARFACALQESSCPRHGLSWSG